MRNRKKGGIPIQAVSTVIETSFLPNAQSLRLRTCQSRRQIEVVVYICWVQYDDSATSELWDVFLLVFT